MMAWEFDKEKIVQRRKRLGLSRREFDRISGISKVSVRRIEAGIQRGKGGFYCQARHGTECDPWILENVRTKKGLTVPYFGGIKVRWKENISYSKQLKKDLEWIGEHL